MKTKLSKFTLNAKKWRVENGCTTPEWIMYVKNRETIQTAMCIISCVWGAAIAYFIIIPL